MPRTIRCCFQWFKDTKMKANHNKYRHYEKEWNAVSNGSKILKWKQITTYRVLSVLQSCCFQWFKDTKMKANHNNLLVARPERCAVSNGSKILKWKQITTQVYELRLRECCFQWFKDTKMKANHNANGRVRNLQTAVSNGSKILKWKQITTPLPHRLPPF